MVVEPATDRGWEQMGGRQTPQGVADAVGSLRSRGVQVFAADMGGESLPTIPQSVLAQPTAWIFGNEAHGVDPASVALADKTVSLPQYGQVESLNISTAAAVCLYQSAFSMRSRYIQSAAGSVELRVSSVVVCIEKSRG